MPSSRTDSSFGDNNKNSNSTETHLLCNDGLSVRSLIAPKDYCDGGINIFLKAETTTDQVTIDETSGVDCEKREKEEEETFFHFDDGTK